MITAGGFGIGTNLFITFVHLLAKLQVVLQTFLEIIRIDKIFTSVIRRIDVNHLDTVVVLLLQDFQHLEVITLDENIIGCIPIFTFIFGGLERRSRRVLGCPQRLLLARPKQPKPLIRLASILRQQLLQLNYIHLAIRNRLRH